jgi:DNA polymerase (family 10)
MPKRPPSDEPGTPPAPAPEPPDTAAPLLSNGDLARVFHEIGDLLEVKGEVVFKTVAYHRAADAIDRWPESVAQAYRDGRPPAIPGVGKALADKLDELARTGRLAYHERLRAEFPATLIGLLDVPGVGPKTVRAVYQELGVESVEDLGRAARSGRIREMRGFSLKTEQAILDGIEHLQARQARMHVDRAEATAARLADALADTPGVAWIEPAGSLRRRRESVGDLDLLAETTDSAALVERFTSLPGVDAVLGAGSHKAAVRLAEGPQVDLMIVPPGEAGTYRIHFTGSKAHNVRLRSRARDRGWSLSEKGFLRISEDGEPVDGPGAELRTFATESEAYAFLDLAWIPPELREDRGEIEAADEDRLPALVKLADLRGDLHSHSDWSDGTQPIEAMAEAARRRGLEYLVLTDHTVSLAIARGLDPGRFGRQRGIVDALNARYAAEEASGSAPGSAAPGGFRLLHGCELEIRADASLDLPDEVLADFDVVVASLHVGRRQPRERLTERVLAAISSPHVDVIAHPAGRMIGERDDLDLEWEAVYAAAAETGTALEINGSPPRLDLAPERARRAVEVGCLVAIDSDAHRIEEFEHLRWGTEQARRAWVEPGVVLNARPRDELLAWVAAKDERVGG